MSDLVDTVAAALWEAERGTNTRRPFPNTSTESMAHYRRLAQAAIAVINTQDGCRLHDRAEVTE